MINNKKTKYADFHTHTTNSDGVKTANELVEYAKENEIGILAITDHDYMMPLEKFKEFQEEVGDDVLLVRGTEASCAFVTSTNKIEGVHIVVLFPDAESDTTSFQENILDKNKNYDRRIYINKLLLKIEEVLNVKITYEELQERFGEYVGRPHVAIRLAEILGSTPDHVRDQYIGSKGLKKAYVPNPHRKNFATMAEIIEEAKKAKGIPILAHPLLYSEEFQLEIMKAFHEAAGEIGGIEYYYAKYGEEERKIMEQYLDIIGWNDPIYSVGSDYHGIFEVNDISKNKISTSHYMEHMLSRWNNFYEDYC